MCPTWTTRPARAAAASSARPSASVAVIGFSTKQWSPAARHAPAKAAWLSAGVTMSAAATCASAAR
jgi:hypothetical protein